LSGVSCMPLNLFLKFLSMYPRGMFLL
jgi:hypothetical protein